MKLLLCTLAWAQETGETIPSPTPPPTTEPAGSPAGAPSPAEVPADAPPRLLEGATPTWPPAALLQRVAGKVVLQLKIDTGGAVTEALVVTSLREDVDAAAVEAAKRLRFAPAIVGGIPTEGMVNYGFVFTPPPVAPTQGAVQFRIVDADDLELPGAAVRLTGPDGSSVLLPVGDNGLVDASGLDPGAWTGVAERDGFQPAGFSFNVSAGQLQEATIPLLPNTAPDDEVLVIGVRQRWAEVEAPLAERREATVVAEVISATQMSRTGDSDAASAMKRVTGLTVVGGRYVYVRGLGDRYSLTLLNGSTLPSPEPEKRVVPLDLFPTALLDGVRVEKGVTADRPAEFGGGIVELRTRNLPEEPLFQVGISGAWTGGTTLQKAAMAPGGPTDFLTYGAAARSLPAALSTTQEAVRPQGIFSEAGYSAAELEELGEAVSNRWDTTERTMLPDLGLQVVAGRSWTLGGATLGALGALSYNNAWDHEVGSRSVYSLDGDELTLKRETDFEEFSNPVRLAGVLALGASWGEREILSTTLFNRSSLSSTVLWQANDPTGSGDSQNTRTSWEERQLLFQQLSTHQLVGPLWLDARYAYSLATRQEPDRREYSYLITEEGEFLSQKGSWNEILYGGLKDQNHDIGLDLGLPLKMPHGEGNIKVGGQLVMRDRGSSSRRFSYEFRGSDGIDLSLPIGQVLTPEYIGAESEGDTGYLQLIEYTSNSDDYQAKQLMGAAYLMSELPLLERWKLQGGLRMESSNQSVRTFEQFDTSKTPVQAELDTLDFLPSLSTTFALGKSVEAEELLLRLGYGRTLSRPEFRELSEVPYYDYRTGRTYIGNPDLQRALIDSFDLRLEWYPRPSEAWSVGVFAKIFQDPIESVVEVSAVSGSVGSFANAKGATNLGAEVELRQYLDPLHEALAGLYVAGNASFIWSQVDLGELEGNQTSSTRPLQGQSPYVVNGQIGYDLEATGTGITTVYNVFGPRIIEVGSSGIPDSYELPVHRLDLMISQELPAGFRINLKASNLLDWPSRQRTGSAISEESREGWSAGLGLRWDAPKKE